jgi:hypothetical protein
MTFRNIVLVLSLVLPTLAMAADDKGAVRAACKPDVKANCATAFTRSQALSCLIKNAAKLSAPCTSALKVASCNAKAPADLKATFACSQ